VAERLLMIEDDSELASMVSDYLAGFGMTVVHCRTAAEGLAAFEREAVDAVILDIMLPDLDGLEICRRLRRRSDVPILMLTARGDDADRIVGLEIGADDYLPKPFNPRELLARLRAVLRRAAVQGASPTSLLRFGRLTIDPEARAVLLDGEARPLTGHQFDLLLVLARNAGRVLSRQQLMDLSRGKNREAYDRSIDVHVSRIRAAIEADPERPQRILTVRGVGYVFARRQDEERGG
jgi:DNA-binding response OmpR family regulator